MHCYVCDSESIGRREGEVRDDPGLLIHECKSCGLVFLSSQDHITENFYEDSSMHDPEDVPDIKSWLNENSGDDERRFTTFSSNITNKSVLDFGCGVGGFLLRARALAKRVDGVELETRLQPHYRKNKLNVYGDVSEIPREPKYDLVTAFHVVEHLPDPRNMLKQLAEHLTDGGQVIVEVPSAADALLTLYRSEAFSKFSYWSCHLYLFTAHSLEQLAIQAGLKVNYIKQVQRYPLSNHLHWLAKAKPGGHQQWSFLDSDEMHAAYESALAGIGACDTLVASFSNH